LALDLRLHQLQHRLKKEYDVTVVQKQRVFYYKGAKHTIQPIGNAQHRIPQFLRSHGTFIRESFANYYSLSQTQAKFHLRNLEQEGIIRLLKKGRSSNYQVLRKV